MSIKDCIKLKKQLDPEDLANFDTQFKTLTDGGIPAVAAYDEAAQMVMDDLVIERNALGAEIREKGGAVQDISLENLLNPASYTAPLTGEAADIGNMSSDDFDALLEDSAPAPADTKPAPKPPTPKAAPEPKGAVMTEAEASTYIRNPPRIGGLRKSNLPQLHKVAKAAGIAGHSKMKKDELVAALQAWQDQRMIATFPDIAENAAESLRAAIYTRGDTTMGAVVASEDPAMAHYAVHHGATKNESKHDTYEGGKTGKGYHFNLLSDFTNFVKAYTGKSFVDEDRLYNGGEPTSLNYQEDRLVNPSQTFAVGDKVKIVRHGDIYSGVPSADVIAIEIDPVDNRPLITVSFTDPDGIVEEETFDPSDLEPVEPSIPDKKGTDMLKAAAKHGVKGADEALTGLAKLFGGKGKFSSGFTFDRETYAKARPHFKKALEEFIAAGKSLKEFIQYIVENFGEGIKPYLKQFHQDISSGNIEIKGVNDVQSAPQVQDTVSGTRAEPVSKADVTDAGERAASATGQAIAQPGEERAVSKGSIGLPVDSPVDVGEQGNIDPVGETAEFPPTERPAGRSDTGRGTGTGTKRVPVKTPGSDQATAAARADRARLKTKPSTSIWLPADPQNIADSLPELFIEQQEDVVSAEERLFNANKRGVLFTNGTGTGKTYSGLGIIKRMVMQGKSDIIIIVPGEKVASDWIHSAKDLDLTIKKLKNIKDAGQGIVVTTYANLSENNAVVERSWDLVVHDEAHKLSENAAGEPTNALKKSRALTGHPDGIWTYASSMEADLLDEIETLKARFEAIDAEDPAALDEAEAIGDEWGKKKELWEERSKAHRINRNELWEANTTKRLDLTATPFAYEKSVDHAEGFLFEYDRSKDQARTYNQPDGREAFFVEHFGYRMRYNRLTTPEADVDSGLMQRQFNTHLRDTGALMGRPLTVDHDYSREFIAIDDLVGQKIDEGYDHIQRRANDKNNDNQRGYQIMEEKLRKHFNYHARIRMLEAIKARFAVERAQQHIALGRKVVLFHSRIQGGTVNPFSIFQTMGEIPDELTQQFFGDAGAAEDAADLAAYNRAAEEFNADRQDLLNLEINTVRPLDLFAQEFGDTMTTYNGTISNKAKRENPDLFNSDDLGVTVIALQDDAGKEGLSLHDFTGKHQRALINLGLPIKPTQAIQIEGRIYRVGQMSNAIFEYFNTGTNFERMTFAEKISERASTAENLAMGDLARTLKDSFIDAYEDPSYAEPSPEQGTGGKERDRAAWGNISEFERAKTHYFGTLKTTGRRDQREGLDYFATPEPLGLKMVEWANMRPNDATLEPSAGHGAIARYFPEHTASTFIEPSTELLSRLALRAPGNHRQMQFEDLDVGGNKYDTIVMNPPFGAGGATAIAHLNKAMSHLKWGGRIVALIPQGPAADKKLEKLLYGTENELETTKTRMKEKRRKGESWATEIHRIDQLENFHKIADIGLPPVTFTRAGTAINAHVIVLDKVPATTRPPTQQPERIVYAENINELFDQIEHMTVAERGEKVEDPSSYLEGLGMIITEKDGMFHLTGKTFEHRDIVSRVLRNMRGTWARGLKAWVVPSDPTNALYEALNAPAEPAPTEAAPVSEQQASMNAAAAALFGGGRAGQIPSTDSLGGLIVTMKQRASGNTYYEVSGETYPHRALIKALGGKWYRKAQAWTFDREDPTDSLATAIAQKPSALRSRRAGTGAPHQVRQWLKAPLRRLAKRIPIKIVDRVSDVPELVKLGAPEDAKGFAHPNGNVYLIASNIGSQAEAREALEHEVIGHFGLEGMLGKKKFNELIGDVINLKLDSTLAPGAHPEIVKVLADIRAAYLDEDGNYTLNQRDEAAEILAHIAHGKPRLGALAEVYNKLVNWFRQALITMGFGDPELARIEQLLAESVDYVTSPDAVRIAEVESTDLMAMRTPKGEIPEDQIPEDERELYRKLGMDDNKTMSLWKKMKDLKDRGIMASIDSAALRQYEGLFDGMIQVLRYEMEAGIGMGKTITYTDSKGFKREAADYEGSAYISMRMSTGVADMMSHILDTGMLQWVDGVVTGVEGTRGFLDLMGELGTQADEWLIWMAGNRAEELMKTDREHNLDPKEIKQAKAKRQGNETLFDKIKEEYNKMNRLMLDFAEQAGEIDAEKRAEWESEWYVPFYRQIEDKVRGPGLKPGFSHQSAGIRRILGAPLPTGELLENVLMNWVKLVDSSVKNDALRLMVDNFKETEFIQNETMRFTKALVPKSEILRRIKVDRAFAEQTAQYMGMQHYWRESAEGEEQALDMLKIVHEVMKYDAKGFESMWSITEPKDPSIIRIKRDGKNEYWRIMPGHEGLLRAVGHINKQSSDNIGMRAGRWFKRILTIGVTASPDFMLRNFIRDAAHAWAINKDGFTFGVDSVKGLMDAMAESEIHQAMMASGASFQGGYVHGTDPEAIAQIMRRKLRKAGYSRKQIQAHEATILNTPGKLKGVLLRGWEHYRSAGDKVENANRIATAKAGMEAGKPRAQWLFESKDVMDYSRRGNFALLIMFTDLLPFLNARMQGVDKLGRATLADPKILARKLLMIGTFSVILAMLNDDDDRYQELPDWEKDAYWHFWIKEGHWRIPKPFEIGVLAGTMPERMYRAWVTKSQPSEKVTWSLMHGLMETINFNPIPQFYLPVAEVRRNRSYYFDAPIESMSDARVISSQRYNQYTSETAIALGDTALAEWADMSPKMLQHLWHGYTGTMGAYALELADFVSRQAFVFPSDTPIQPADLPVVKAIYQGQRKKNTQYATDFYDRLAEVEELYGTVRKYRNELKKEEALEFRAEHRDKLKLHKRMKLVQTRFGKLRKQRDRVMRDDSLSPAEKYTKTQEIQMRINELAKKIEGQTRAAFTE